MKEVLLLIFYLCGEPTILISESDNKIHMYKASPEAAVVITNMYPKGTYNIKSAKLPLDNMFSGMCT